MRTAYCCCEVSLCTLLSKDNQAGEKVSTKNLDKLLQRKLG